MRKLEKNEKLHAVHVIATESLWKDFEKLMRKESLRTRAHAFREMMRIAVARGRITI